MLENEELMFAGIDIVEAGVACVISCTTSKGVESIIRHGCMRIFGEDPISEKEYNRVSRTIKIASKVIGGRLAGEYAKDISSVLKGAYYGYRTGRKMAEGRNIGGSESEVLASGSEEE